MSRHIHPSARIADDVYLGPYVLIGQNVVIDSGARIEGFASIGTPPEHRDHFHDEGSHGVRIGRDCVIREFVSITAGTDRPTILADGVVMLRGSYAAHDVVIDKCATISGNAMLGGHSWVGEGANLGFGVAVRQFLCIGGYAMVGMNSTITRHVPPFAAAYGSPATARGVNRIGLERAGLDSDAVERWWSSSRQGQDPRAQTVLPARESALERAWRTAVEASGGSVG